jgi:hypothetical protein
MLRLCEVLIEVEAVNVVSRVGVCDACFCPCVKTRNRIWTSKPHLISSVLNRTYSGDRTLSR